MIQDTFLKIVRPIIESKNISITSSKSSQLNALARRYSAEQADVAEVLQTIKSIFSGDFGLGRHEYGEIEKHLKRY